MEDPGEQVMDKISLKTGEAILNIRKGESKENTNKSVAEAAAASIDALNFATDGAL